MTSPKSSSVAPSGGGAKGFKLKHAKLAPPKMLGSNFKMAMDKEPCTEGGGPNALETAQLARTRSSGSDSTQTPHSSCPDSTGVFEATPRTFGMEAPAARPHDAFESVHPDLNNE